MAEVDEEYLKEIEMARTEFRTFITNNKCAPLMLQLAWSDAATYDARRGTGGPNGSVRLRKQGLKNEESKRLDIAVRYCEIVKTKLTLKRVSYADLFQLAGVVAVQVTEGPTIDFVPGRKDSNECPRTEWRFLNGEEDARDLRKIFFHMGLCDDKIIVALCGGHTLIRTMYPIPKVHMGGRQKDDSKLEGEWTKDPLKFDNSYFKELLSKDASFARLSMDYALVEDQRFLHYVQRYSKDEKIFFKEYAISHKKLSELGCNFKHLNPPRGPYGKLNQHTVLVGIGIVSVVMSVIVGYMLKRKKNQLKN